MWVKVLPGERLTGGFYVRTKIWEIEIRILRRVAAFSYAGDERVWKSRVDVPLPVSSLHYSSRAPIRG